ncbi:sensor histidine kinase [Paenibacillus sp. HB172176]|uniref:cache domain-containing sensor histidine kinase n=1 Tax=Paenibacillus sp. HB172176 TaxID=2493690 RepID=UPI00143B11BB|nr:sensor histidine kinase [Paenibacillus sp. HB172176]
MKTSLRKKLMIVLLAATILPISISMFITYQRTTSSITKQAMAENSKLLFQGESNLANYFELFNKLFNSVYYDANAGDAIFRLLRDGELPQGSTQDGQSLISSTLRSMAMTNPDIFQIRLSVNKTDTTYLLANDLIRSSSGSAAPEDSAIDWKPEGYVEATHASHPYGLDERKKFTFYFSKPVVSFHRPVLDIPSEHEIGRLSIDLSLDYIRSISEMLYTPGKEELWIVNASGDVVYSSSEDLIGTNIRNEEWVDLLLKEPVNSGNFNLRSSRFDGLIAYQKLTAGYMDWTIVKRIPYDHLYSGARQITRINMLVLGCFLLVTVIATILISYRMTEGIKRLIGSINAMQAGNLQVEIPIQSKDEIGVLARRFRQLMAQINHLILREYKLEIANKTYQLKALQAQVHPHFLYNALQSIGTLALKNQDRNLYKLIASLGKLMRYHMNTEETVVPLKKEIEHVKAYLELQKQRFGEQLHIRIETEPSVENIEVPKMIIQPLAENIFKHGMNSSDKSIVIAIQCRVTSDGGLALLVEDNGQGIALETVLQLQAQLERPDSAESLSRDEHIGLANVLMRLRLFFNTNTTMTLRSAPGEGFAVRIHIGIEKGDVQ